jgi:hypothetical protein
MPEILSEDVTLVAPWLQGVKTAAASWFQAGGVAAKNKKTPHRIDPVQRFLSLPCDGFYACPSIFLRSASGVEMGVKSNFSTRTLKILGDMNAGRLGPM